LSKERFERDYEVDDLLEQAEEITEEIMSSYRQRFSKIK
jgi:hypothetical protein